MGFSHTSFSVFEIPSFEILSFVIPSKTFLVLSFSVSCVNPGGGRGGQAIVINFITVQGEGGSKKAKKTACVLNQWPLT